MRLNFALTQLAIWRKQHAGNTAKRCLEAVREGIPVFYSVADVPIEEV